MGAWDIGPFGNDDATDFLAELEEAPDVLAELHNALTDVVDGEEYLEVPEAALGVAVAAILVLVLGRRVVGIDPLTQVRIGALDVDAADARSLAALGLTALDRVVAPDSELAELWDEAGHGDEWRGTLADLRAHLGEQR